MKVNLPYEILLHLGPGTFKLHSCSLLNIHLATVKQHCILIAIAFLRRKEFELAKTDCILETSQPCQTPLSLAHSKFSALNGTVCMLANVCQDDDN